MKQFAVFIDRDGAINYDPGNFHKIEELKILPRVGQAINLLNAYEIPAIIVTNQPVVARGWITEEGVKAINSKIERILAKDNAKLTKFYYCPHHPEADLVKYRVVCECRKPATALFEKAAVAFGIKLENSYVVGDSFREIEAAKNLGCQSIAVKCGRSDFRDAKADFLVEDLYGAIQLILKSERALITL